MPEERIVRAPVYKQVTDALIELIRNDWSIGGRFLTEREVSERFGVSRTTANKALSNLVTEGVLEFRKGVGTFVAEPKANVNLRRLVSFTEKARAAGLRPETEVRSLRRTTLEGLTLFDPGQVETALTHEGSRELYELERVRSINGEPAIYERRVLRADLCPELYRDDLAGSLYTLLYEKFNLELDYVIQHIRARNTDRGESSILHVTEGAAALELTTTGHITGGDPLWYETTLYRGDRYEFVNELATSGTDRDTTMHAVHAAESDRGTDGSHQSVPEE